MALTKTQRVYSIHKQVDSLFEIIKKTLGDGEDILISGFGKFCVKEKGKRRGRGSLPGDLMLRSTTILALRHLQAI